MFCRNCGWRLENINAPCPNCSFYEPPQPPQQVVYVPHPNMPVKPKYWTAGFVLGILSICIPFYGFILGVIGLPLACISKRRSAIILNIIGLILNILWYVLAFYFSYTAMQDFHHIVHSDFQGMF